MGWASPGTYSPVPLSALEIQAWANGAGHRLEPWEFEALQDASRAYVDEYLAENRTAPDGQDETLADPEVIDARAARLFDKLAAPVRSRNAPRKTRKP